MSGAESGERCENKGTLVVEDARRLLALQENLDATPQVHFVSKRQVDTAKSH
jgi:hypothetical protein